MDPSDRMAVLQRLLQLLCRSLPRYLQDAPPWSPPELQAGRKALDHLAADQQLYAQRVAEAIVARGGRPESGSFPLEFTAVNDLAVDFLLQKVLAQQRCDIEEIARCAAALADEPPLHALAEEILGNATGHLEIVEKTRH